MQSQHSGRSSHYWDNIYIHLPDAYRVDNESALMLLFLSHHDRLLNVREASRRTGISRSTTSRVLATLRSKGILNKVEAGNQVFHSLNARNSHALAMCSLALSLRYSELGLPGSVSGHIASFVKSCRNLLGEEVLSIVLFGSTARREAGKGSDIDLLVILRTLEDAAKVDTAAKGANASRTNRISPTTITREAFASELRARNALYRNIVREGIPIFGSEAYLREFFDYLEEAAGWRPRS